MRDNSVKVAPRTSTSDLDAAQARELCRRALDEMGGYGYLEGECFRQIARAAAAGELGTKYRAERNARYSLEQALFLRRRLEVLGFAVDTQIVQLDDGVVRHTLAISW